VLRRAKQRYFSPGWSLVGCTTCFKHHQRHCAAGCGHTPPVHELEYGRWRKYMDSNVECDLSRRKSTARTSRRKYLSSPTLEVASTALVGATLAPSRPIFYAGFCQTSNIELGVFSTTPCLTSLLSPINIIAFSRCLSVCLSSYCSSCPHLLITFIPENLPFPTTLFNLAALLSPLHPGTKHGQS